MELQPVRPTVKTPAQAFTGDVYPTGTPTPLARPSTSPKAPAWSAPATDQYCVYAPATP